MEKTPENTVPDELFFRQTIQKSLPVAELQARIFVKDHGKSASECANRGLRGVALNGYRIPVCPNPPVPRSVSSSVSVTSRSACATGRKNICAIRSPR